jgi:diadenosine tetraphosphate (Ap4A) HIT family hydrolase
VSEFVLHPHLAADTQWLCDGPLSCILLMNDARYPWLILVPRRPAITELHELPAEDRSVLIEEIARASAALKARPGIAKVNVGALGNIVPQLHVHAVGRVPGDAAWPGPVWGRGKRIPYAADRLQSLAQELRAQLMSAAP